MGGQVLFEGQDLRAISGRQLQQLRDYLQNPFSLDPRMKIGDAVMEPLLIHSVGRSHRQRRERAAPVEACGAEADRMNRFPRILWWSNANVFVLPVPSLLIPSSSFATNRSRRWMSQCRRKC